MLNKNIILNKDTLNEIHDYLYALKYTNVGAKLSTEDKSRVAELLDKCDKSINGLENPRAELSKENLNLVYTTLYHIIHKGSEIPNEDKIEVMALLTKCKNLLKPTGTKSTKLNKADFDTIIGCLYYFKLGTGTPLNKKDEYVIQDLIDICLEIIQLMNNRTDKLNIDDLDDIYKYLCYIQSGSGCTLSKERSIKILDLGSLLNKYRLLMGAELDLIR